MALNGTYKSNFISVTDGDTTDIKPSLLADTSKQIRLKNFEVRWRGDRSSHTETEYSNWVSNSDSASAYQDTNYYTVYEDNKNYATATSGTTTETKTKSNSYSETWVNGYGGSVLVVPYSNSGSFIKSVITYELNPYAIDHGTTDSVSGYVGFSSNIENYEIVSVYGGKGEGPYTKNGTITSYDDSNSFVYLEYNKDEEIERLDFDISVTTYYDETVSDTGYASTTYPSVPNGYSFNKHRKVIYGENNGSDVYYSNKVGESVQVSASSGSTNLRVETEGYDQRSNTTTYNQTASASFPSPPSGYDFYRHRIEKSDGTDNYFNTNSVGESRSITSYNTYNTVSVTASTRGINEYTVYTQTKTPSLSGDASLSPNISSVQNDTTTSWYSLSNLLPNSTNTLQHDIQGSNKAEFQYRFDWGVAFPEPVYGKVAFYNNELDRWEETAVADSTDELLEYSHIEVYNESMGEWGCLDVVDASKTTAIEEYRFYDAETDKWLAPRKYSSTQV
jgi:hypothetical protein